VYLKCNGYQVIPVNPRYTEIFGNRSYQSVSDIPCVVDLVVGFRRPQDVPAVARDVIEASPKYLWLQPGIRNDEAAAIVENQGIAVYQDICIKQTHQRLAKASVRKH
jgi:predicted CoA-binding protein